MVARSTRASTSGSKAKSTASSDPAELVTKAALAWLAKKGSARNREGMARYGIVSDKVFGVSVGELRAYAKKLGKNHALARSLWRTGCYEARMLATMVAEPAAFTPQEMDAWCKEFDNWAICDTTCFGVFDRSPHAFRKVKAWARRKPEFEKRASFALLASLALHDRESPDDAFLACLPLVEAAATDERNFVKKGVSWALRSIGQRSPVLHEAASSLAQRLTTAASPSARWVGKDATRDLSRAIIRKRVEQRANKRAAAQKKKAKKA